MLGLPSAQLRMLAAVLLAVPLSAWGAVYPQNTWLQVGPVILLVAIGAWLLRRRPLTTISVGWIVAFLLLHLFAARWTYSSVPYDRWIGGVVGLSLDQTLGFQRNMFDRLVHFAFGVCFAVPLVEIGCRYFGFGRRPAIGVMLLAIWACGAFYEVFEWLLAVTMDPVSAEAYNGQQGDMFDPQKDMLAAGLGGFLALTWIRRSPSSYGQET